MFELSSLFDVSILDGGDNNESNDDENDDGFSDFSDSMINFYASEEFYGVVTPPKPAEETLPFWYNALEHIDKSDSPASKTMKACQPALDGLTAGWTMCAPVEIEFGIDERGDLGGRTSTPPEITGPPVVTNDVNFTSQLGDEFPMPLEDKELIQISTQWKAHTPEGYSTLILPPLNRPIEAIRPFAGVIDTDKYPKSVNTVCMYDKSKGGVKLGPNDPLCTVITIKRDNLGGNAGVYELSDSELKDITRPQKNAETMDNGYVKQFWEAKPSSTVEFNEEHIEFGYEDRE